MASGCTIDFSGPIPIFPLPNCVLLPRAILPLHIFEPRYREMIADALAGDRLVSVAVLKPGYEEKYYTHVAAIHPTVCVGYLVRHETLSDGRYNVLLQGVTRARVGSEDDERSYRRGVLIPQPPQRVPASTQAELVRRRLLRLLKRPPLGALAEQMHWPDLVRMPDIPLSDLIDYLASSVSCCVDDLLKFLVEADVPRRVEMLTAAVQRYAARMQVPAEANGASGRAYPRNMIAN